jgi:hypothetical protein
VGGFDGQSSVVQSEPDERMLGPIRSPVRENALISDAAKSANARAGISHVQLWLEPNTMAGIDAFLPVLERLDRGQRTHQ